MRAAVRRAGIALQAVACFCAPAHAQEAPKRRVELLSVAREIIAGARYAAFITTDSTGFPQARTVEPFAPDSDFVVWFGTNPRTRKVSEIRRDSRVALHWFDPVALGYVTLRGRARVVSDSAEKRRHWKPGWEAFYPDREKDFLLVVVQPERLEIVSPRHGVAGDAVTWRPPEVRFP